MTIDYPIYRSLLAGSLNITHLLSAITADSGERFPFVTLTGKLRNCLSTGNTIDVEQQIQSALNKYVHFDYATEHTQLPSDETIRLRRMIGSTRAYSEFVPVDSIPTFAFQTEQIVGAAPIFIHTAMQAELHRTRLMLIDSMRAYQDDERSFYMLLDNQQQLLAMMKTAYQRTSLAANPIEKSVFQWINNQLLQTYCQQLWLFLLSRTDWATRLESLPLTLETIVDYYSCGQEYPSLDDIKTFQRDIAENISPYVEVPDYLHLAITWTMACSSLFVKGVDELTITRIWSDIDRDSTSHLRDKLSGQSQYVVICGFLGLAKDNLLKDPDSIKLSNKQIAQLLPIEDEKPISRESAERHISSTLNQSTHSALCKVIKRVLQNYL